MEEIFVDRTLYNGAPEDLDGRCAVERETYAFLKGKGVSFQRVDHGPAMTIAACEEVDRVLGIHMCKNLFLCNRQKTDFYLLLMPGRKPFRTKELSSQIQAARLSFADETYMREFLGLEPGSVTVLGLIHDADRRVRLLIDEDLLKDEYIGCHPCINTSSLKIRMKDLLETILPATGHTYTPVHLSDGQVSE